jgi:cyclopropane fatty-acyl-phospholipid synthase-like methyltransferase
MSVVEPVIEAVAVPDQREVVVGEATWQKEDRVVGVEMIDHVTSHSIKCYWDFVDCRWQCSDE